MRDARRPGHRRRACGRRLDARRARPPWHGDLAEEMTPMEQPTDVQDVRVVHFGLGPLGVAIAGIVAERDGLTSVAAYDPAAGRGGRDLAEVAGLGITTDVVVEST